MNITEKIEQLKDQVLPFRPFDAMEEAERLVNKNPTDAETHFFLANIYKLLNRHHDAALTFEKTYELLSKSYDIKLANVNEISKVDAGLSCMSLRW